MELNEEFDALGLDGGESQTSRPVLTRRAIVVVGSHRSGTSALARVLSLVGCDLPRHVVPPQQGSNELGFWEPEPVVQAHEEFLDKIGSSWDDVAPLPDGAFVSKAAEDLRQQLSLLLREEYGASPLFVVKDPRISRLSPLWFAVLADLQITTATAIVVRNPLEVAASLKARDGFTTPKSLLFWLRHVLESEHHSRGRPRSIVMYDELLRDWQEVLGRVAEDLDLTWPGWSRQAAVEIENFLSKHHRHHVFDWSDLEEADAVSWARETYFALQTSDPLPVLDQIRNELAKADEAFGPIVEEARSFVQASREQVAEAANARDALAAEVNASRAELEARAAEVEQLQSEIGRLSDAVGGSESGRAELEEEVSTTRAERDRAAAEAQKLRTEMERRAAAARAIAESLREEVRVLHSKSARHRRHRERAEHLLAAATERQAFVEKEAASMRREAIERAAALAQAERAVRRLDSQLQDRDESIRRLSALNQELVSEPTLATANAFNGASETETDTSVDSELTKLRAELAQTCDEVTHLRDALSAQDEAYASLQASLSLLQRLTKRRARRRTAISQFCSWLFPPKPSGIKVMLRYWRLRRGHFDADEYLLRYPDVARAGLSPLMHYAEHGVVEGRTLDGQVTCGSQGGGSATSALEEVAPAGQDLKPAEQGEQLKSDEESEHESHERASDPSDRAATAEAEPSLLTSPLPPEETSCGYEVTILRPPLAAAAPPPIAAVPKTDAVPSSIATREAALRAEVAARFRLDRGPGSAPAEPRYPTISFLMPVFRPPLVYLDRAIRSVMQQSFGNWQLCIVDDASENPELADLLQGYASSDMRITVAHAHWNGGIAEATNAALALAQGEYVGLLDHDDMLTVDAVELVTRQLLDAPDTDLVYSDECTLDTNDVPLNFFSKPDWSPFLLLSCMYTGHLSVYRRTLVQEVGGFRSAYNFSQDYDLALRVAETNPRVRHLAECLYGWRSIPESATQDGKPHARQTNIAALQDALDRRAIPASAEALPTSNRFVRHASSRTEFVSLIMPSDDLRKIYSAVLSIQQRTSYRDYEIIVVTNSQVCGEITGLANVRSIPYDKPFSFSDKCNVGARSAHGSRLVFVNDDVEVLSEDWLEVLLDTISVDDVGAVAPRLVYGDGSTQHAGMVTGVRGLVGTAFHNLPAECSENFGLPQYAREVSVLSGACLMVRADVFSQIRGFDALNTPIDHSDIDLCFRIRERGLRCVYTPFATLRHLGHQSLGESTNGERGARWGKADLYLLKRWSHHVAYDPYFTSRMRGLHFRDSQELFNLFPGLRSARPKAFGDVLLVSHDLSNSGAPRALLDLGRVLKEAGCYVCVSAPADGPMREQFTAQGIDVVVDELLLTNAPSVLDLAAGFDFAIANTAVTWQFVAQVSGNVPVYWFLHESELIQQLACENDDFVRALRVATDIWAAGPLPARQLMKLAAPVQELVYGVDTTCIPGNSHRGSDEPLVVGMFGSYEPRKGQDLAILGLLEMPSEERAKVRLNLWGRVLDAGFVKELKGLAASCPQVHIGPELSPQECLSELASSDVVLVPSRDDPLPLSSLDALACSRILIASRTTGTSEYLEHGVSAFILENNSPQEIAEILTEIIRRGDRCSDVRAAGHAAFEAHFSWEAFTARVHELLARELDRLQPSSTRRRARRRGLNWLERPNRAAG